MKKQFFGFGMMAFAIFFANTAMADYVTMGAPDSRSLSGGCRGDVRTTIENDQLVAYLSTNCSNISLRSGDWKNQGGGGTVRIPQYLRDGQNTMTIYVESNSGKSSQEIVISYNNDSGSKCQGRAANEVNMKFHTHYSRADVSYLGKSGSGNYKYSVYGHSVVMSPDCVSVGGISDARGTPSNSEPAAADASNALL